MVFGEEYPLRFHIGTAASGLGEGAVCALTQEIFLKG